MAPGPGPVPTPGHDAAAPVPGATPYFDPYAEPTFMPTYDMYSHATFTPMYFSGATPKASAETTEGDCMDYVWDEHGVMSYGPVPCPTPSYMSTPSAPRPTWLWTRSRSTTSRRPIAALEEAASAIHPEGLPEEMEHKARVLIHAIEAGQPITHVAATLEAEDEHDACDKVFEKMHVNPAAGICIARPADERRRALKSGSYSTDTVLDPSQVDPAAASSAMEAIKSDPDVVVEEAETVPPAEILKHIPDVDVGAVNTLVEKAHEVEVVQKNTVAPMPVTTPPQRRRRAPHRLLRARLFPPEGYVHAESNLEFNVDRAGQAAVVFEVNSEKFTSLTCSEAPTHHFQGSDYCKGADKCDEVCHTNMPPKCNATAASFGVCAPTVDKVCEAMENSKTACMLASQKVIDASISYNHLDVQNSPCISSVHKVTADAHEGVPRRVRRVGFRL